MTWHLITFLALWAVGFAALVFMAAATPSTERVSNSEVLALAGLAGLVASLLTLVVVGLAAIHAGVV